MSDGDTGWKGRRKRTSRRLAYDLRASAPLITIALCFVGSATAIYATESAPTPTAAAPRQDRAIEACPAQPSHAAKVVRESEA